MKKLNKSYLPMSCGRLSSDTSFNVKCRSSWSCVKPGGNLCKICKKKNRSLHWVSAIWQQIWIIYKMKVEWRPWRAIMGKAIGAQYHRFLVQIPATAVMPRGKVLCLHCLVPRSGLKAICALVTLYVTDKNQTATQNEIKSKI